MGRLALAAIIGLFATSAAWAGEPSAGAVALAERQRASEIASMLSAGNLDQTIDAARGFLATVKDEKARVEGMRVLAEALRRKGDWKMAYAGYAALRSHCEKGSDEFIRYDAIAEVIRVSPSGVYQPTLPGGAPTPPTKVLSEDEGLVEALARFADMRAARLKSRVAAIRKARTPQEVVTVLAALAEEFRQLRVLAPALRPDAEREAAQAAGLRLAELAKTATAALNAKDKEFQAAIKAKRLTEAQRTDMDICHKTCLDMAEAEEAYQASTGKMGGTSEWPEGAQLAADSKQRGAACEKLAKSFVAPPRGDQSGWQRDFGPDIGGRGGNIPGGGRF
jgi:hypothetical protein